MDHKVTTEQLLQPYKSFVMVCAEDEEHKPRQAFATLRRGFKG